MQLYYFITLDKTCVAKPPTRNDYHHVFMQICERYDLKSLEPYHVQCFEYKEKGSTRRKTKVYNWLHFHAIVEAVYYNDALAFPKPQKLYYKGYSIELALLKTMADVARVAGYIQKEMIDEVQNPDVNKDLQLIIRPFNIFDEYAFEDTP